MAIQGIEGVISQLQATAMTARNQNVAEQQPTISFAGQLHAALDRISDTQTAARTQAEKFTLVRNKLVSAYQEVMGMQV